VKVLEAKNDFSPPYCIAVDRSLGVVKPWSLDISVVCNQAPCPTHRKRFLKTITFGGEKQCIFSQWHYLTCGERSNTTALRKQAWVSTNKALNSRRLLCTLSCQ
jgi:hypothetical protein